MINRRANLRVATVLEDGIGRERIHPSAQAVSNRIRHTEGESSVGWEPSPPEIVDVVLAKLHPEDLFEQACLTVLLGVPVLKFGTYAVAGRPWIDFTPGRLDAVGLWRGRR